MPERHEARERDCEVRVALHSTVLSHFEEVQTLINRRAQQTDGDGHFLSECESQTAGVTGATGSLVRFVSVGSTPPKANRLATPDVKSIAVMAVAYTAPARSTKGAPEAATSNATATAVSS